MTCNAEAHGVIDNTSRHGHASDIAVTLRALDRSGQMRRVIESYVSFVVPAVNALPRNVFTPAEVRRDLLNRRFVRCDFVMAGHARRHARYRGPRSGRCIDMTIQALHLRLFDMCTVNVGDGLDRVGPQSEKVTDGQRHGGMCRSKYSRRSDIRCRVGRTRASLSLQDTASKEQRQNDATHPQGSEDNAQRHLHTLWMPTVSHFFHTAI